MVGNKQIRTENVEKIEFRIMIGALKKKIIKHIKGTDSSEDVGGC